MAPDETIRNAVLKLWIKTGNPVTQTMLVEELEWSLILLLNERDWCIKGTEIDFRQDCGALLPTRALLREHILELGGAQHQNPGNL